MRRRRSPSFVVVFNVVLAMIAATGSRSPIAVVAGAVSNGFGLSSGRGQQTCEPIVVESCRHIGYNLTSMPNLVNDETQSEAERQIMTFQSLVQYGCSKKLQLFLCASYFPMCTDKVPNSRQRLIGPCRNLCQSVRSRCEPTINQFGFSWPPALDCMRFPATNGDQHMCMDGGDTVDETTQSSPNSRVVSPPAAGAKLPGDRRSPTTMIRNDDVIGGCVSGTVYVNRSSACVPLCDDDAAYTADEKRFLEAWLVVWVVLCFASTAFAMVTCVVKADRWSSKALSAVDYKQSALTNMSFCFAVHTVGYFVRLLAGRHAASCGQESAPAWSGISPTEHIIKDETTTTRLTLTLLLVEDGLRNPDCAVIFVILYYFSTAAWIWWTIGTCRWMIASIAEASASLPEPVEREATTAGSDRSYGDSLDSRITQGLSSSGNPVSRATASPDRAIGPTHAVAWSVAGLLTVVALVMRSVGADELTGICSIDWRTTPSLLIGPLSICACLSTVFLVVGITSTCRHQRRLRRRSDHSQQPNIDMMPTTQLMSTSSVSASGLAATSGCSRRSTFWEACHRGGALSMVMILVPVGVLIGCYCYEYVQGGPGLYVTGSELVSSRRPSIILLSIRAAVNLVVGTAVGLATVWDASTPAAWRKATGHLKTALALRCRIGSSNQDRKMALYQGAGQRHDCNGAIADRKTPFAVESRALTTFLASITPPMTNAEEHACRYHHHHHHHVHNSHRCHHVYRQPHQWERQQCDCCRHGSVAETALYASANVKHCADLGDRKQMKVLMV